MKFLSISSVYGSCIMMQIVFLLISGALAIERSANPLLVPDSQSKYFTLAEDLASPLLFVKQLDYMDENTKTRHERQIKFKSSYSELPEVLQEAEDKQNIGKSLSPPLESIVVIPDDAQPSDSAALKKLPPSSEVYFKPKMDGHRSRNFLAKQHFGKSLKRTVKANRIHPTVTSRKLSLPNRSKEVGIKKRKSVRQTIPNPKKIQSRSDNSARNRLSRRGSRFISGRTRSHKSINQSKNLGGPNASDDFRNPHLVKISSGEVSSYSSVPEESFIGFKPTQDITKSAPVTPVPIRVHQGSIEKQAEKLTKSTRNHFKSFHISKNSENSFSATNNLKNGAWSHFTNTVNSLSTQKRKPHLQSNTNTELKTKKNNRNKIVPRRGKSLNSRTDAHSTKSTIRQSALLSIPETGFDCGGYHSGEYFADLSTNCQVFHVCYDGRKASFRCPAGTAFSQSLLVCDWVHKVKCGG